MTNQNEKKKSKYFKDDSNKRTSKYIKAEGAQTKSKYFKTDEDRAAEQTKVENRTVRKTSYHKTDDSENLTNRAYQERIAAARAKNDETIKMPQEVTSLDEAMEHKGDHASIFTNKEADISALHHYREAEQTPDESRRRRQIFRNILICIVITIIAVVINFIVVNQNGEIEFMPAFLTMEFSAVPEFIASLAYGPVVGLAIVVVKNVLHILLTPLILHSNPSFISEMSNVILDTFFIFLGGWIYTRRMFNFTPAKKSQNLKKGKDYRTQRILLGGFVGTAATSIATFFTTRFLSYPLLIRFYSSRYSDFSDLLILQSYQTAVDNIRKSIPALANIIPDINNSFNRAILVFNVPLTFMKFLFITIVTALLYPPISDFLHYRVRSKRR